MPTPIVPITPSTVALRPCPFCSSPAMLVGGGTEVKTFRDLGVVVDFGQLPYGVECSSKLCEAKTQVNADKGKAIANWNTRPDMVRQFSKLCETMLEP
jgi:Restriction alleviation protein Lar